jgi:hypothetical protein
MRRIVACIVAGLACIAAPRGSHAEQGRPQPAVRPEAAIEAIAKHSQCAASRWDHRGNAPESFIGGVALVYARAACHPDREDVRIVSAPASASEEADDGLAAYARKFAALGMKNDVAGSATLRHAYLLLLGLGMMESAGKYCDGRDVSQCFTTAGSAEAGLFQTSYGARHRSPALPHLIAAYSANRGGCRLDEFKGGIACTVKKSHNPACPNATSDVAGVGPGADWQRLTKACPAFATEYAAVLLRIHGGTAQGEFGPIRHSEVELKPECDTMLVTVEDYVRQHPQICSAL